MRISNELLEFLGERYVMFDGEQLFKATFEEYVENWLKVTGQYNN